MYVMSCFRHSCYVVLQLSSVVLIWISRYVRWYMYVILLSVILLYVLLVMFRRTRMYFSSCSVVHVCTSRHVPSYTYVLLVMFIRTRMYFSSCSVVHVCTSRHVQSVYACTLDVHVV